MNVAGEEIQRRGWARRTVGVEMDAYYFTARSFTELKESLPEARIANADLLVNWVRLVKSDAEIALMKEAGKIAERVMQTAIDRLEPGVRECDAVADVYRAQMSGTERFGGDYPSIVPMMPTGEKTSAPHLTWTDAPYENEQMVNLELAACRHRYHCPIARTAYLGKQPPDKLVSLANHTVEGLDLTLDAIRPGMRCEEVEQVWRGHIAKAGLTKESRIGYAMGLNYPPDWGEHTASLRPGDKTVLAPNMTFHMILGMWMDDYGFECSESFRVTESGCATFANFPRKLFVKG
jgi:Xaa-Pro dipeptidase